MATATERPLLADETTNGLTLRKLEDHLWQAADFFRNKVSDQKDYTRALFF